MTRGEVVDKLAAHRDELRQMGVVSLTLFGSAAREETREESDIDLLVEFDRAVGVFHFFKVQHRLEENHQRGLDGAGPGQPALEEVVGQGELSDAHHREHD